MVSWLVLHSNSCVSRSVLTDGYYIVVASNASFTTMFCVQDLLRFQRPLQTEKIFNRKMNFRIVAVRFLQEGGKGKRQLAAPSSGELLFLHSALFRIVFLVTAVANQKNPSNNDAE